MELNTLLSKQHDQEKEIDEKNETILPCVKTRTNSDDQEKETSEINEMFLSCVEITEKNSADQEKETSEKDETLLPPLKIINKNSDDLEDDDDGFKTPTSSDQRIPLVTLQCPPAPMKPKITKRKALYYVCNCRRRIILDVDIANEVENMFPNSHANGDLDAVKTKKSRK